MDTLRDKVAVVTGGSGGIGIEIGRAMLSKSIRNRLPSFQAGIPRPGGGHPALLPRLASPRTARRSAARSIVARAGSSRRAKSTRTSLRVAHSRMSGRGTKPTSVRKPGATSL